MYFSYVNQLRVQITPGSNLIRA